MYKQEASAGSRVSTFVDETCSPSEVPLSLLHGHSVIQSENCVFTTRLLRTCTPTIRTFFKQYRNIQKEMMATVVL
ncbi:hypothetical protein Y032_0008g82 [Ancylostoma ceylanicum]|uniref:Uncharacterized protein n=1 Tax=Ancylostoma ceylanicum TaxID=53326 RepID=A0A016VLW7_9BILA|nr:hypothetical protein Y032_0008g82 [Ancylostoma ceylanicum]